MSWNYDLREKIDSYEVLCDFCQESKRALDFDKKRGRMCPTEDDDCINTNYKEVMSEIEEKSNPTESPKKFNGRKKLGKTLIALVVALVICAAIYFIFQQFQEQYNLSFYDAYVLAMFGGIPLIIWFVVSMKTNYYKVEAERNKIRLLNSDEYKEKLRKAEKKDKEEAEHIKAKKWDELYEFEKQNEKLLNLYEAWENEYDKLYDHLKKECGTQEFHIQGYTVEIDMFKCGYYDMSKSAAIEGAISEFLPKMKNDFPGEEYYNGIYYIITSLGLWMMDQKRPDHESKALMQEEAQKQIYAQMSQR